MTLIFLDKRIEAIDAVVREAEAQLYGEHSDNLRTKTDVRLMLAALGRDIAARQLPQLSRLEIGSIDGFSPEGESFLYKRSEGQRGRTGGVTSFDHFEVSIGPDGRLIHFYQNAISGYRDQPLRRLLDDFHGGKRRCYNDDKVLLAGITIPTKLLEKPIDYEGIAREAFSKLFSNEQKPKRRPPPGEYNRWIRHIGRSLPEHEALLIELAKAWRPVQKFWPPDIESTPEFSDACVSAATAMIEYYQKTGEGLFVPDEGITVGHYNNNPGQPVRLFPDRQLYIQIPLLQEASFWRRKLVVIAPPDYQEIRCPDLLIRGILAHGSVFRGKEHIQGIIEEYERVAALTGEPNPMAHITSGGFYNLRRFAHVDLSPIITPADQRALWFNGGQPANHTTEYTVPERLQEHVDITVLRQGPGILKEYQQKRLTG